MASGHHLKGGQAGGQARSQGHNGWLEEDPVINLDSTSGRCDSNKDIRSHRDFSDDVPISNMTCATADHTTSNFSYPHGPEHSFNNNNDPTPGIVIATTSPSHELRDQQRQEIPQNHCGGQQGSRSVNCRYQSESGMQYCGERGSDLVDSRPGIGSSRGSNEHGKDYNKTESQTWHPEDERFQDSSDEDDDWLQGDNESVPIPEVRHDAQPQDINDDADGQRDMSDNIVLTQDRSNDFRTQDTSDDIRPQDMNDDLRPQDMSDDVRPQDMHNNVFQPEDMEEVVHLQNKSKVFQPQDVSNNLRPRNTSDDLRPRDMREDFQPRDMSDDIRPRDMSDDGSCLVGHEPAMINMNQVYTKGGLQTRQNQEKLRISSCMEQRPNLTEHVPITCTDSQLEFADLESPEQPEVSPLPQNSTSHDISTNEAQGHITENHPSTTQSTISTILCGSDSEAAEYDSDDVDADFLSDHSEVDQDKPKKPLPKREAMESIRRMLETMLWFDQLNEHPETESVDKGFLEETKTLLDEMPWQRPLNRQNNRMSITSSSQDFTDGLHYSDPENKDNAGTEKRDFVDGFEPRSQDVSDDTPVQDYSKSPYDEVIQVSESADGTHEIHVCGEAEGRSQDITDKVSVQVSSYSPQLVQDSADDILEIDGAEGKLDEVIQVRDFADGIQVRDFSDGVEGRSKGDHYVVPQGRDFADGIPVMGNAYGTEWPVQSRTNNFRTSTSIDFDDGLSDEEKEKNKIQAGAVPKRKPQASADAEDPAKNDSQRNLSRQSSEVSEEGGKKRERSNSKGSTVWLSESQDDVFAAPILDTSWGSSGFQEIRSQSLMSSGGSTDLRNKRKAALDNQRSRSLEVPRQRSSTRSSGYGSSITDTTAGTFGSSLDKTVQSTAKTVSAVAKNSYLEKNQALEGNSEVLQENDSQAQQEQHPIERKVAPSDHVATGASFISHLQSKTGGLDENQPKVIVTVGTDEDVEEYFRSISLGAYEERDVKLPQDKRKNSIQHTPSIDEIQGHARSPHSQDDVDFGGNNIRRLQIIHPNEQHGLNHFESKLQPGEVCQPFQAPQPSDPGQNITSGFGSSPESLEVNRIQHCESGSAHAISEGQSNEETVATDNCMIHVKMLLDSAIQSMTRSSVESTNHNTIEDLENRPILSGVFNLLEANHLMDILGPPAENPNCGSVPDLLVSERNSAELLESIKRMQQVNQENVPQLQLATSSKDSDLGLLKSCSLGGPGMTLQISEESTSHTRENSAARDNLLTQSYNPHTPRYQQQDAAKSLRSASVPNITHTGTTDTMTILQGCRIQVSEVSSSNHEQVAVPGENLNLEGLDTSEDGENVSSNPVVTPRSSRTAENMATENQIPREEEDPLFERCTDCIGAGTYKLHSMGAAMPIKWEHKGLSDLTCFEIDRQEREDLLIASCRCRDDKCPERQCSKTVEANGNIRVVPSMAKGLLKHLEECLNTRGGRKCSGCCSVLHCFYNHSSSCREQCCQVPFCMWFKERSGRECDNKLLNDLFLDYQKKKKHGIMHITHRGDIGLGEDCGLIWMNKTSSTIPQDKWENGKPRHGWYLDNFGKFNTAYCKLQLTQGLQGGVSTNGIGFIIKKAPYNEDIKDILSRISIMADDFVEHFWCRQYLRRTNGIERQNTMFVCTRYHQGGSLSYWLKLVGKEAEPAKILDLLKQALNAADILQDLGILYLNWHANNLVLSEDTSTLLLSNFTTAVYNPSRNIRPDRHMSVNPRIAPPELINCHPLSPQSDIWGIGCLLYQMLTGHMPYPESRHYDPENLRAQIRNGSCKPPMLPSNAGNDVANFLGCCWMLDPQERATIKELQGHQIFRSTAPLMYDI